MVRTIEWAGGKVRMINQTLLPLRLEYADCATYLEVADCIKTMKIRGAPAIGIAASMGIALGARDIGEADFNGFMKAMESVFQYLLSTRPTAVNIKWAVERMRAFLEANKEKPVNDLKLMLVEESRRVLDEDIEINRSIGRHGAKFVKEGARVLTHCNAGALATGGYGTATAPMRAAHEAGRKIHVFADETRPLLQGARLTAWELKEDGIPVTLITDNSAGSILRRGMIDLVIVGTDRTTGNGDVANKIGTYPLAVMCKEHGVPFYVAAPLSSIDFTMASGDEIPIEERSPDEVTTVYGGCRIAPEGIGIKNYAFDVTPAKYVTAIITELGAFRPSDIHRLAEKAADPESIRSIRL